MSGSLFVFVDRTQADRLIEDTENLLQGIRDKEAEEEREWSSLTGAEKEAGQKLFLDGRREEYSRWWGVMGNDGVWRRKRPTAPWWSKGPVEELLEKYVFTSKGIFSSRRT